MHLHGHNTNHPAQLIQHESFSTNNPAQVIQHKSSSTHHPARIIQHKSSSERRKPIYTICSRSKHTLCTQAATVKRHDTQRKRLNASMCLTLQCHGHNVEKLMFEPGVIPRQACTDGNAVCATTCIASTHCALFIWSACPCALHQLDCMCMHPSFALSLCIASAH